MYMNIISTEDLAQHLQQPDWVLVDCRFALEDTEKGRREYREAHIPRAIYAHLDEDLSAPVIPHQTGRHPLPDIEVLTRTFSGWGIEAGVQVVVYDDAVGAIAARLWWMLRWLGHQQVAVLNGGWHHWRQEARPTTDHIQNPVARPFEAKPDPALLTDAEHVLNVLEDPAYRLLDARAADRYRGENETIDPVAGHIPHARSAPFIENVENGLLLSPKELRSRFQALLGKVEPGKTICYCGSGVTSCHNLLALVHAGLGDGILYAGSWSDWITVPDRPLAR